MMNNFFHLERESRSREKTDNTGCFLDREHKTSEEKEHCCSLISMRRARERKRERDVLCPFLFADFTRFLSVLLATPSI
jgi:hypothetical protein